MYETIAAVTHVLHVLVQHPNLLHELGKGVEPLDETGKAS